MIVECKNCGAPLDVKSGEAFTRCSYCGQTSKVKSSRTLLAESPPGWTPPPTWQPPPQYKAPQVPLPYVPQPLPRMPEPRNPAGCFVPVAVAVVVLGFAGFALFSSGALTALPFVGLELDGAPSVATVDLAQLPLTPITGVAAGTYSASTLGSTCRGYLPRTPQLLLRTSQAAAVRVGARDGNADLVMAIRTADGTWLCDDDTGGSRMPLITATLPAGDHRVFVGPYTQGEGAPFTFVLDAQAGGGASVVSTTSGMGLLPDAAPQIGEIQLDEAPLDGTWPGRTSGWTEASRVSSTCRGSLPAAPHLRIRASVPREVQLVTRDNANVDLVMLIQGPDGRVICDDDSGGSLNPRIRARLEPGVTNVWVGPFHAENTATFTLELDALTVAGPGAQLAGEPVHGTVSLDVGGWRARYAGVVSPDQRIEDLGAACGGFVGQQHDLVVLTSAQRNLTLTARGAPALRVVVRGPDGAAVCSDGGMRNGAVLRHTFLPGTSHVWVGALGRGRPSYELLLAE